MFKTIGIVKGTLLTEKQRRHVARRLEGKSVLEWVVRQMTDCELLNGVVVLAEEGINGDIVRQLTPIDVPVFSSASRDTLSLLQQTLEHFPVDACVFIGADWPFLDPTLIDQLVHTAELEPNCDYAAYQFTNEIFSAGRPYGLFPEWYRSQTIRKIATRIDDQIHRQLPGTFFLDNQKKFNVELLPVPASLDRQNNIRFTFDTEADWDTILELHEALALEVLDYKKIGSLIGSQIPQQELV
ncbi:MAG: NTP transferase domain-containing protein [Planctomycetaceae bacterium]|jgi:spore coat polysaccharide biosynthesis protein SpsF (cytidylyltransferase family)|nr:NTP transferase domain-containing protein [Planctomycetaceae bacterium]